MAGQLSLRKNFTWAFVGNIFNSICMWLILMILAKFATAETVGFYGVAQAVALPISMLLGLKLQLAQVTDARRDFDFGHYFAVTILISIATIATIAVVGFSLYPFDTALVVMVLGVSYGVMSFRYLFMAVMQKAERMDKAAISLFLTGVLLLILFGVIFWFTRKLALGLAGLVIARVVIILVYDYPVSNKLLKKGGYYKGIAPCWHANKLWSLVKTTAPLGLIAWVNTLYTSMPNLFLDKFMSRAEVGYFTAMSAILVAGSMLIGALAQAVNPRLATYYISDKKAFITLILKFIAIAAIIGMAGIVSSILFGSQILAIIFTAEYTRYTMVLTYIMIAGLFFFLFAAVNNGLATARKFTGQLLVNGLAAIACIAASFFLIPRYGITGAALSLTICYATGFLGCLFFMVIALIGETRSTKSPPLLKPLLTSQDEP